MRAPTGTEGSGTDTGRRAGVIIVAAGSSARMNGVDKMFMPILGKPLISYALAAFEAAPSVESITLVLNANNMHQGLALVHEKGYRKVHRVCVGGEQRQESVRLGLEAMSPLPWVVVHDGARPCVNQELIEQGLTEAMRWGSAVAAVRVKDTVKVVSGNGREVEETLDRSKVWLAQTPQVFSWEVIRKAHAQKGVEATDDAALVEGIGHPVHLYSGSYANVKVTTREDTLFVETILRDREGSTVQR
jgi:2-C-methyl-D-erythritol 4-phosphate cytidylyltransferase